MWNDNPKRSGKSDFPLWMTGMIQDEENDYGMTGVTVSFTETQTAFEGKLAFSLVCQRQLGTILSSLPCSVPSSLQQNDAILCVTNNK